MRQDLHAILVGAGRIGRMHASNLRAHSSVGKITVVDVNQAAALDLADTVGGEVASSFEAAIALDPDFAVIASATPTHADYVIQCVEAGVAAFCEKPIAIDLESTNRVVDCVERTNGAVVQVGLQRRYDSEFLEARRLIESEEIGRLHLVKMSTHDPAPPPSSYLAESGGIFRDMHIHDFDALRFLVAPREVVSVFATGSRTVDGGTALEHDVDTTVITLVLDDGSLAVISGCRQDPLGYDVRAEVFGTLDSITVGVSPKIPLRSVAPNAPWSGDLSMSGNDGWSFFIDRFENAYRHQLNAFIASVLGDEKVGCTVHDARAALILALACERSIREGESVTLKDLDGKHV